MTWLYKGHYPEKNLLKPQTLNLFGCPEPSWTPKGEPPLKHGIFMVPFV